MICMCDKQKESLDHEPMLQIVHQTALHRSYKMRYLVQSTTAFVASRYLALVHL